MLRELAASILQSFADQLDPQTVASVPIEILDIMLNVAGETDIGTAGKRATMFYGLHYFEMCADDVLNGSARSRIFNLLSF